MRTSTTARKGRRGGSAPASERSSAARGGRTAITDTADAAGTGPASSEGAERDAFPSDAPPSRAPSSAAPASEAPPSDAPSSEAPGRKKRRGRDPLLAAICHDLRAPLAAVTMGANFVLQTTPEDEASGRSRRVLQAILRSCKQMERLVRDFGDLSEIEGDAVELRVGVHDAGQMIEMSAEAARQNALARNVQITVSQPATPLLLRCDRDRMLRALGHVIDNAVRFSPDGGTVALSVEEIDGKVCFKVTDHGPGLSDETLANLYNRTWHGRRADRVGAGLGLAIVRGFLDAHGGTVDVESKPGIQTTFMLTLPKDMPPGTAEESEPETTH